MKSHTKISFDSSTIKKLVKAQFGSASAVGQISPLTSGWFNSAYEIEFTDGTPTAVLRIAPDPNLRLLTYEKDMMRKELQVYETITEAVDSGVVDIPIPRLLGADTRRVLIDCDFMFIEKYSGQPMEVLKDQLSPEDRESIYQQIGSYTAALHKLKHDTFGYFGSGPGNSARTWREAFSAFVDTLLTDGEALGVKLPLSYEKILELLHQYTPLLDDIKVPALVHWDLWPVNIFIIKRNGKYEVEGIIDWERAYWGDPESEPSIATQHYGSAFFQGYGQALTEGQNAAIRHKLYLVYLLLVMNIEAKVRFEGAEHLTWVQTELTKELSYLS